MTMFTNAYVAYKYSRLTFFETLYVYFYAIKPTSVLHSFTDVNS